MLSHRDILRDVRRALKALPDHPSACEVTRVPGAGTQTIVVRDASGRPLLTLSALAAVWAPVIPGRHQRTLDAVAPRPELPEVPPLAVDPMAPGFRIMRVGDLVFAPDRATWEVGEITRATDHGAEGEIVRLDLGTRCVVVDRAEITLDAADLWECAKLPVIPAPITETVRVWVREEEWDTLSDEIREEMSEPIGGSPVEWEGRVGFVTALVPDAEVRTTLRGMLRACGCKLHEGDDPPAVPPKPSKKPRTKKPPHAPPVEPSTRCETIADVDAMIARDDADAVARESHPIRALIVHDAGADSLGARKGLHAWSAERTPGAGSQSGGDLAPLVMLWTPATDSPDVAKLLARYAKVNRPVLDLGVIARSHLNALAPFQPEVRARWNAAHPAHRVSVPEAKKTARKGGAK